MVHLSEDSEEFLYKEFDRICDESIKRREKMKLLKAIEDFRMQWQYLSEDGSRDKDDSVKVFPWMKGYHHQCSLCEYVKRYRYFDAGESECLDCPIDWGRYNYCSPGLYKDWCSSLTSQWRAELAAKIRDLPLKEKYQMQLAGIDKVEEEAAEKKKAYYSCKDIFERGGKYYVLAQISPGDLKLIHIGDDFNRISDVRTVNVKNIYNITEDEEVKLGITKSFRRIGKVSDLRDYLKSKDEEFKWRIT